MAAWRHISNTALLLICSLRRGPESTRWRHQPQTWGECIVFVLSMPLFLISLSGRFFLFLVLDKVVCPFMVKYFEMPIWHPTSEKALDELLDAKVDV